MHDAVTQTATQGPKERLYTFTSVHRIGEIDTGVGEETYRVGTTL